MRARLWLLVVLMASAPALAAQPSSTKGTPVLISSEDSCEISVDGTASGTASREKLLKLFLSPGEHLVTARCAGGGTWTEVAEVGAQQKVLQVKTAPAAAGAAAPAAPAATAVPSVGGSGIVAYRLD